MGSTELTEAVPEGLPPPAAARPATTETGDDDGDGSDSEKQTYPLWTMLRYYRCGDYTLMGTGLVACMGVAAGEPVMYSMFGDLIDRIYSASDVKELGSEFQFFGSLFLGLSGVVLVSAFCQMSAFEIVSGRQSSRIRATYLRAILRQDSAWFDGLKHGALELPGSIAVDALALKDGLGYKSSLAVKGVTTFTMAMLMAYIFGWQVAIAMSGTFILIMSSQTVSIRRIAAAAEKDIASYSTASGFATETLTNLKTVAAFGAEAEREEQYTKYVETTRGFGLMQSTWTAAVQAFPFPCTFVSIAIATVWGSVLVRDELGFMNTYTGKPWTTGDVLRVMFLVETAAGGMAFAGPGLTVLAKAQASLNRVMATIDGRPAIDNYSDLGEKLDKVEGAIQFDNVSFCYPARQAEMVVKRLTLSCAAGQRVAVVGGSGEGKSTLISLILRFYDVSNGTITLDGVDIRKLSLIWLRRQIGLVSQEPVLFGK